MSSIISNLSLTNNSSQNTVQIGDNLYEYYFYLVNPDKKFVAFKYSGIHELRLVDDLKTFFTHGYMVFNNTLDAIESTSNIQSRGDAEPYVFRGDGRDYLIVSTTPNILPDDNLIRKAPALARQRYNLKYIFSVYNYEDIITEDKDLKLKRISFHDYAYQVMKEKTSYFTTGRGTSNTQREVKTGQAIKNLITETFRNDYNIEPSFDPSWDSGGTNIFYSSPADYKAIDDLYYLLDYHVSGLEGDYTSCLLRKNRQDVWELKSLNKLFKEAYFKGTSQLGDAGGVGIIENFTIGKQDATFGINNTKQRTPSISTFADSLADYSVIENFQLANMTAEDAQTSMTTNIVHNYNFQDKLFSVDMLENNYTKNLEVYNKNFVRTMKGTEGRSPYTNIVGNELRVKNKNVNHVYSPSYDPYQRLNAGRNRFLLSGVFLNTAISFRARGLTAREAGKFITIDRADSQSESTFDSKLLGIYLIIKVEHLFYRGAYINNIIAVKTYNSDDLKLSSQAI
jgi:hypothetical protein